MNTTVRNFLCFAAISLLLPALAVSPLLAAVTLSHPCMLHTQEDIGHVKASLGSEPLSSAYAHLQESQYAQLTYTEHTSALLDGYLKRMDYNNWGPNGSHGQYADYNNYTASMRDAAAAYQLALRYRLSDDTRYADAAVAVLNAWAIHCKGILKLSGWTNGICDPNLYLILIQGHQFANAAELLRDYGGWAAADFTAFKTWMRNTFYDLANLFLTNHHGSVGTMHYWLNWDLAALTTVLSVGILCDDQSMVNQALNYYKTVSAEAGYVRNAVPYLHQDVDSDEQLGQCQESGRDQGHATLCVSLLGTFCQMALNVGEDLFAYDDYRALKMAEYVAKYNLPTAETYSNNSKSFVYNNVPYTAYSNNEYSNPMISADSRGTLRPCWEVFAAYARRHLLPARYCEEWVVLMRAQSGFGADGGAGDYGNNSGGFDQLGYGSLMYGWMQGVYPARVSGVGYTTLNAAFNAISAEGTIELYDDITITGRCNTNAKTISIVPKTDGITISSTLTNSLWLLNNNSSGRLTIGSDVYALTIDGGNLANSCNILEASGSSITTVRNTIFKDCWSTHNSGIITEKTNGKLYLDNVSFVDCTTNEGRGVVFAGSNEVYLVNALSFLGNNAYDIYLENKFLRVGDMTEPVKPIILKYQTPALGAVVLSSATGGDKSAFFEMSDDSYGIVKSTHYTDHYMTEASSQTITSAGAATLILPFESKMPKGIKAYTLNSLGGNSIMATEMVGTTLPANTPVLLNGEAGNYKFTNIAKVNAVTIGSGLHSVGALTGVYETTTVPQGCYILKDTASGVGFVRVANGTVQVLSNRCYLTIDNSSREFLDIVFGDATSIVTARNKRAVLMGQYYNLAGLPALRGFSVTKGRKVLHR